MGRSAPPGAYRVKITYLLIKNIEPWNVTLHARSPSLPLLKLILKLLKNTQLDLGLIMNNCKVNKTKSGTQNMNINDTSPSSLSPLWALAAG